MSKGLLLLCLFNCHLLLLSQDEVLSPKVPNLTEDSIGELMSLFINKDKAYGDTRWY
ncbi:hypothetical protein OAB47_04855 [Vicingaceae bacterium]|nr:hypothetical protein [Vicingaceae bacterium]